MIGFALSSPMIDHQCVGKKALGKAPGSRRAKTRRTSIDRGVPKVRLQEEPRYQNDPDGSFAWVAANASALYKRYPDRWILVDKARVVDSGTDPNSLLRLARTLRIREPFVTMTNPPEQPGRSIYAGKVV